MPNEPDLMKHTLPDKYSTLKKLGSGSRFDMYINPVRIQHYFTKGLNFFYPDFDKDIFNAANFIGEYFFIRNREKFVIIFVAR